MSDDLVLLRRRLEREKLARRQAEQIAEEKSRAIYVKSRELEEALAAESRMKNEVELLLNALEAFTSRLEISEIAEHLHRFLIQVIPRQYLKLYLRMEDHFQVLSLRENTTEGGIPVVGEEAAPLGKWASFVELKGPQVIQRGVEEKEGEIHGLQAESASLLVLPLSAPGHPLGFITIESPQPGSFTKDHIRFAQALANEAAVALENALLFREVKRLSLTDPLTGLNNRRSFDHSARQMVGVAIRHQRPLSVLMLDIDFFKKVNDTYGHAVGDQVLTGMAQVCRQSIRSTDLLARFGGEEFSLLFPETPEDDARPLAERLRQAISALVFEAAGQTFSITASLGISECSGEGDSLESLLERSDAALYQAKKAGRNRAVIWGTFISGPATDYPGS